jgi:signal transduction histidine kinase
MRLFNVLAAGGTAASLLTAAVSAAVGAGAPHVLACLALAALSAGLLAYSARTGDCRTCYYVSTVVVFLVFFPVLFFTSGGYRSGMPAFFVFAVAFTAAMLEGRAAVALSLAELAVYASSCAVAYLWPDTVRALPGERAVVIDTVAGFTAAASVLGACILLHFRMYDERQRRLAELNEILEGACRVKTEFLSHLSHEMRAPLAAASVNVQTVREILAELGDGGGGPPGAPAGGDAAGPGPAELLEGAQGEIMRLARMVGGMLALASLCEGARRAPVDLSALVLGGAEAMRLTLARRGNALETEVEPGLRVLGVADFLAQVEANLLSNACAHTRDGAVTVRAARAGREALVTVADTGDGIAPGLLPRVFERGVSAGGTGFGLYLCRSVVESHGGRIWIESERGRGTAVSFALPALTDGEGEGYGDA